MTLYEIINQLASTSSNNAKMDILKSHVDNTELRDYFLYTLDPYRNYFIRVNDLPAAGLLEFNQHIMCDIVDTLSSRLVTGNAAKAFLNDILSRLNVDGQILVRNMINHDPNCNVAGKMVNKCWPNLIPSFGCMLAEAYDEKAETYIKEGKDAIIVQKKEDGGRVQICVSYSGGVTVYSRSGNILEVHGVFDTIFGQYPGYVFDGELVVYTETGMADRKTGNGYFNKAVRGTISPSEASKLHVVMWDMIALGDWTEGKSDVAYTERLNGLLMAHKTMNPGKVSVVDTKFVDTHEQAFDYYARMIDNGFEGAMIKQANMPWINKRSTLMLKMKETKDATLRCIGTKPHKKNPELIGSLECQTEDGLLEVSIGSGLSKSDREKDSSEFVGKLIDMQYNMLIDSKTSTKKSMFLPRYRSIRLDQTEADTLSHLK